VVKKNTKENENLQHKCIDHYIFVVGAILLKVSALFRMLHATFTAYNKLGLSFIMKR
jgi:hypothetical protein